MKFKRDIIMRVALGLTIICGTSSNLNGAITSRAIDDLIDVNFKKNYEVPIEYCSPYTGCRVTVETSDNGLVTVGMSDSLELGVENKGKQDAIIIKYNYNGVKEWINNFGGSKDDYFNSIIETSDKGLLAVGYSYSDDAGFNSGGDRDGIIVKYDYYGNQQWFKNFGGDDWDELYSVVETSDKGFVVAGVSYSSDAGFEQKGDGDAVVVKYDYYGNQQWVRNFGGQCWEEFWSVIETSDGGIVVAGFSESDDAGFTLNGWCDGIIIKYDSNGNQKWINSFSTAIGSERREEVFFRELIETSDGKILVVGDDYQVMDDYEDGIIIKYTQDGIKEWEKFYRTMNSDYLLSVTPSKPGGFYTLVWTNNNKDGAIVTKYNNDGDELWFKAVEGINKEYTVHSILEADNKDLIISAEGQLVRYGKSDVEIAIEKAEQSKESIDIETARDLVNQLEESELKNNLQDRLNAIVPNLSLTPQSVTSNLDIYIKSENMLSLSLDTNSVTFEDFSGVEDVRKENAVNLTVNSSLPYKINAYMVTKIQNSDGTNIMDKEILNIKANGEADYNTFVDTNTPIVLFDDQPADNNVSHGIDLMLKGNLSHEKDIYKTVIKFEAEQK